jgi:hypothetical protein
MLPGKPGGVVDREVDLYPAFIVARKLGVSRQLVRSWVVSGKLEPAGEGKDGRALYRYADAVKVDRDTRRSPLSTRNPQRQRCAA